MNLVNSTNSTCNFRHESSVLALVESQIADFPLREFFYRLS